MDRRRQEVSSMTTSDLDQATQDSREEQSVTSRDGTRIAFDRLGTGPAVILVGGATMTRQGNAPLAEALAGDFTVLNYDRRGGVAAATRFPIPWSVSSRTSRR
jgi:hypothetical protein